MLYTSSGEAWEISQFWQNLHWKLQPTVAIEKEAVAGRTWKNGFFSIGSK
jgi:hypothetical protein